jgi:hypothetical protein
MIPDKTVAIHQPNFFPWLGYFAKIAESDVFVFLDDVQFPKTGGVWSNRVKLLIGAEARWATAAIDRNYRGTRTIREMQFLPDNPWREKLLKSLEGNYRRNMGYPETMDLVAPLLLSGELNVAEYNIQAVTAIAQRLGFDLNKLRRSSDLPHEGRSNDLLCSITRLVGGSTYMCGGGAAGYQDEAIFNDQGVELLHQQFVHPVYSQRGRQDFVAGLSIIDAAMNLGWDGVKRLLKVRHGDVLLQTEMEKRLR